MEDSVGEYIGFGYLVFLTCGLGTFLFCYYYFTNNRMHAISSTIEAFILAKIRFYLQRYTLNFNSEQAVISLWEGNGSLRDLELNVDALNEELNLPFALVSGQIGELLIHVPWPRVSTYPVKLTVCKIELSARLKTFDEVVACMAKHSSSSEHCQNAKPETSSRGWGASMGTRIVCNLAVKCSNISLTFIDRDVTLLLTLGSLTLDTVNSSWLPEFCREQVLCVDVISIRVSRDLKSGASLKASSLRIGVLCPQLEITLLSVHVPLLLSLYHLVDVFIFIQENVITKGLNNIVETPNEQKDLGWVTWLCSYLTVSQTVVRLPVVQSVHFGIYIQTADATFKIVDHRFGLRGSVDGIICELSANNNNWKNVFFGISHLYLSPVDTPTALFISCGEVSPWFLVESLYYNIDHDLMTLSWEDHQKVKTADVLHLRAKTFALDILFAKKVLPLGVTPRLSKMAKYIVGPMRVHLTTRLMQYIEYYISSYSGIEIPPMMSKDLFMDEKTELFVFGISLFCKEPQKNRDSIRRSGTEVGKTSF